MASCLLITVGDLACAHDLWQGLVLHGTRSISLAVVVQNLFSLCVQVVFQSLKSQTHICATCILANTTPRTSRQRKQAFSSVNFERTRTRKSPAAHPSLSTSGRSSSSRRRAPSAPRSDHRRPLLPPPPRHRNRRQLQNPAAALPTLATPKSANSMSTRWILPARVRRFVIPA